jgi:putative ABC transport system substrate-binding protein
MKKMIAVLIGVMMLIAAMAGCTQSTPAAETAATEAPAAAAEATEAPAEETAAPEEAQTFTIGIVQIVEHAALDAARDGFIQALADNGLVEGENVTFDIQNAQGDQSTLSTIGDRFVSENVDLILAIATSSAQTMASKTTTIPILGTAVTDYEVSRIRRPSAVSITTAKTTPCYRQVSQKKPSKPRAKPTRKSPSPRPTTFSRRCNRS